MTLDTITVADLQTPEQRARYRIVEALPQRYFDPGHLPGAVRAVADELRTSAADLLPDPSRPVVVYCSGPSCSNSARAAAVLVQQGYADVRVFAGGKEAWVDAGLPLEVTGA